MAIYRVGLNDRPSILIVSNHRGSRSRPRRLLVGIKDAYHELLGLHVEAVLCLCSGDLKGTFQGLPFPDAFSQPQHCRELRKTREGRLT